MTDQTETIRKVMIGLINNGYSEDEAERKAQLISQYGEDNVWDTGELETQFVVESFLAPFCMVRRRSDNKVGTVNFTHSPRFYFDFQEA